MIYTIAGEWLSQFSSHEPWLYYIQSLKFETVVLKWVILNCWSPKHWDTTVSLKRWEFCPLPQNIISYICRIMESWTQVHTSALCQVFFGFWHHVGLWVDTDVSEEFTTSIFRVTELRAYIQQRWWNSWLCSIIQLQPVVCFLVSIKLYLLP